MEGRATEGRFEKLRGEAEGTEGRTAGQIAEFSLSIVPAPAGLGLTVLGLTVTLVVSGAA